MKLRRFPIFLASLPYGPAGRGRDVHRLAVVLGSGLQPGVREVAERAGAPHRRGGGGNLRPPRRESVARAAGAQAAGDHDVNAAGPLRRCSSTGCTVKRLGMGAAAAISVIAAFVAGGEWETWLYFLNAAPFWLYRPGARTRHQLLSVLAAAVRRHPRSTPGPDARGDGRHGRHLCARRRSRAGAEARAVRFTRSDAAPGRPCGAAVRTARFRGLAAHSAAAHRVHRKPDGRHLLRRPRPDAGLVGARRRRRPERLNPCRCGKRSRPADSGRSPRPPPST